VGAYPVKRFGTIQKGSYRFFRMEGGNNDCEIFEFVYILKRLDKN
jgi:hypothetical protein